MKSLTSAALALTATSLAAQTTTQPTPAPPMTQPPVDFATATPLAGNWSYATASDGSEATFSNSSGNAQLWIHCTRATRRVSIAKPASAAASHHAGLARGAIYVVRLICYRSFGAPCGGNRH